MKETRTNIYLAATVALMTFAAYLPALQNGFVIWDDGAYVFDNSHIRSLNPAFFRWAFSGFRVGNWHPLAWISHALDYAIWGLNPLGHHLTSVILHAINSAFVVLLAVKVLRSASAASPHALAWLNDRTISFAAGATGLLFGLHPVHVESVAWVAERKDLLCGLFFLLSMILYMKYAGGVDNKTHRAESMGQRENRKTTAWMLRLSFTDRHYFAALMLFVLALLSKPMAVTLPAVLLILDWYPLGRVGSIKALRSASVEKIPFIALSIASSVITVFAQKSGGSLVPVEQISVTERALVGAKALTAYLEKMLLPLNLVPFYPYPETVRLISYEYLPAIVLAAVITAVFAALVRKQKFWLAAWAYYVVTLIPVLGIVQVGAQSMADRYTYLPSLAPLMMTGIGTAWVRHRFTAGRNAALKALFNAGFALVFVVFAYATYQQIHVWHDDFSLWDHTIEKGPRKVSWMYVHRGTAFGKKGQTDRAIADLETAIALDPSNYDAYMNLAVAFQKLGRLQTARECIEKAIGVNAFSYEAYLYRGTLYEDAGQLDKALADYTKAITLNPSFSEAYNNRGVVFAKLGHFNEAIADYADTIRIDPGNIDAFSNRGIALMLAGRNESAIRDFDTALSLAPDDPALYLNRAMFYQRTGRNESAFIDFQKACGLGNERACSALHQFRNTGRFRQKPAMP